MCNTKLCVFIGYECERYDNPADFFLNVIHQVDSPGDSGKQYGYVW